MAQFERVDEGAEVVQHPSQPKGQKLAIDGLMLALTALNKRFVVALSNLFTAGGLIGAWLLWDSVLPSPSIPQLVGLGEYAVFFLALEYVRRR